MQKKNALALCAALLCLALPLAAQAPAGGGVYIAAVEYEIRGLVLPIALERFLGIEEGRRFVSEAALSEYAAEKERLLLNNRVFLLGSSVAWVPAPELGAGAARVLVRAEVGWTALAVPFPKYNDADGFSLAIRYKDFNFLGTLEPLTAAYDFYATGAKSALSAEFGLLPRFLGADWRLGLRGALSWAPDPGFSRPDLGVSLATSYPLPGLGQGWSLAPSLSYAYEGGPRRQTAKAGAGLGYAFNALLPWSVSLSGLYTLTGDAAVDHAWTTTLGLSTGLALARLPYFGALSLSPAASLYAVHDLDLPGLRDSGLTLGAGLGLGRVDWQGNFRLGASASVRSDYTLHFVVPAPKDLYDWVSSASASAFWHWRGLVGVNFRAYGRWEGTWTLLGESSTAFNYADSLRGLKDARYGDLGFYYNLEFPVNLAQGRFLDIEKLASEVFFAPFIDGAYVRPGDGSKLLDPANRVLAAGFEFVIFPDLARAFTYRLSVGYDVGDYLATRDFQGSKLELWLGLGLHF